MAYHEKNAAAEVMISEIAATRMVFDRISKGLVAVKNRLLHSLKLGTEADAKIKAQSKHVMHDINYPDVGAVRSS